MKKIFLIVLSILLISGCNSNQKNNAMAEFSKKVQKTKSYSYNGKLEIYNNEETFEYDLKVSYLKDEYYSVEMINKNNNNKQIILKNNDGVYVVNPALNKSYKFESDWPNNSSQPYILKSLIKDMKSEQTSIKNEKNGVQKVKTEVKYPNNSDLSYQIITFDKKNNISYVEIYDESDIVKVKFSFEKIDFNISKKSSEFNLDNYINDEAEKDKETIGTLDTVIYPLYMPSETYLKSSEIIENDETKRAILTFSGDKEYVIVEEKPVYNQEHEIIPVYGEPILLNDSIGALSSNSMYWTSNEVDYYLASDDLTVFEMTSIASSLINATPTIAEK